ncbi:MAG TPA: NAD(P)/FAD-dependent oxidoreductase [Thermoanaerobaculia bacterium]|nr:NAD(P)/FAD-dependent oxidoreductase [Thermoanaerobaculia bacterium]
MRYDVVIVGAGIGGAVLALDLGKRGWRVALVERESIPPRIARPEVLWGATLRALEQYGIAEKIRDACSVRLERIEIGGAKPWLTVTRGDFARADVEAFSTNPSMTRAVIADAALATGNVDVHRGVVVEDLVRGGVRAKRGDESFTIEAAIVVGDDGANSVVRTRLGIAIAFNTFPIDFVTAMIPRWPLPPNRVRVWLGDLPAAFIPWPRGEGVLLAPMPADRAKRFFEQPADVFWNALERVTPMAGAMREQLDFPRDFTRVARPFGHAESYVADGVALIGDAAHPMTPAGGQGANASIADALALADVIHERKSLVEYEQIRRPRNEQSISFSRIARGVFRAGRFLPAGVLVPAAMRTINALGWPKRGAIRTFANAFNGVRRR